MDFKGYKYRIYTDPQNPSSFSDIVTGTSCTYNATTDGTYYCDVVAVDNVNNETPIQTGSVFVDRTGPTITGASDPRLDNGKTTIAWTKANDGNGVGVSNYEAYLTSTQELPDPVNAPTKILESDTSSLDKNSTQKTFTTTIPLDGSVTYYAWVRGIDQLGNKGAWMAKTYPIIYY